VRALQPRSVSMLRRSPCSWPSRPARAFAQALRAASALGSDLALCSELASALPALQSRRDVWSPLVWASAWTLERRSATMTPTALAMPTPLALAKEAVLPAVRSPRQPSFVPAVAMRRSRRRNARAPLPREGLPESQRRSAGIPEVLRPWVRHRRVAAEAVPFRSGRQPFGQRVAQRGRQRRNELGPLRNEEHRSLLEQVRIS
jgi:hypothetical protein